MNEFYVDDIKPKLEADSDMLKMSSGIASAYLSNNILPAEQIADVIRTIYDSLRQIEAGFEDGVYNKDQRPAVPIKKSITDDYIICLEDGKKLKMLKRHIRTAYKLSPEEYRAKWGLPSDYPMVAPNYAIRRSQFAKDIGLGRKRNQG
ncbi:MAG: MucR family transcriptional regulator [Alphaproteobacteria bacterium]|jgi:predicted transcriptional regulator|nr:MucR family transcriptional regulator [Alphaproteobacteria bacterium]